MEAIGAASSIVQIAELGFSLIRSLDKFVSDAKRADRDLRAIGNDVRHLATTLGSAHDEIEAGSEAGLYTAKAVTDFQDLLENVKGCFQKVQQLLGTLVKDYDGANGDASMVRIALRARMRWAFDKKDDMELLRSELEKQKTGLLTMLAIFSLGLARRNASGSASASAILEFQKQHIRDLIQQRDAAERRHDDLLAAFKAISRPSRTRPCEDSDQGIRRIVKSPMATGSQCSAVHPSDVNRVHACLEECADKVYELSQFIESNMAKWNVLDVFDVLSFNESADRHIAAVTIAIEEVSNAGTHQRTFCPMLGIAACPGSIQKERHEILAEDDPTDTADQSEPEVEAYQKPLIKFSPRIPWLDQDLARIKRGIYAPPAAIASTCPWFVRDELNTFKTETYFPVPDIVEDVMEQWTIDGARRTWSPYTAAHTHFF